MRNASFQANPDRKNGRRNASSQPARSELTCACCGKTIITAIEGLYYNPPVGSPQRFCSPACRQAAWRRRRAGVDETAPSQLTGGRSRSLRQQNPPHHHHEPLLSEQEVITAKDQPHN
jgi:hypothetical protein